MRVKFKIDPQSHDTNEMNVFISYRTCDWDSARTISNAFKERGFNVLLFEPLDSVVKKPEEDVRSMLRESLQKADYICIVNTFDSMSSEWIAFEFTVASRTLGRVILINTGAVVSGYETVEKLNEIGRHFMMNSLYVKHTTVQLEDFKKNNIDLLIKEMMNDPDWGWFDSENKYAFETFLPSRGLKSFSDLKKEARKLVLEDPQFKDHYIFEIIPFLIPMDSNTVLSTAPEDHFRSILLERGMLTLLDDFNSGKIFVSRVNYMSSSNSDQDRDIYVYVVREYKETDLGLDSFPDFISSPVKKYVSVLAQVNKIQVFEGHRDNIQCGDTWLNSGTYVDPRDAQEYRTVTVLGKTWFAENLRFKSEDSCYYENDTDNAKRYGRLYTWPDALRSVPPGWRLPTINEWGDLAIHFGGFSSNGGEEIGDANKSYEALIEGGSSGIDIILGGFRYYDGTFKYLNVDGYYWSITEYNGISVYVLYFLGGAEETTNGTAFKIAAHSARCIRDAS